MSGKFWRGVLIGLLFASSTVFAGNPAGLDDNVRYLSMGDSYAAGKGAIPVTSGYAYLLYQGGVFAPIPDTTFANSAMPGTTSTDVLAYQVPQVIRFKPHVITMSVGTNDLKKALAPGADIPGILTTLGQNMTGILCGLRQTMLAQGIDVLIIAGNYPDYPWISAVHPEARVLMQTANAVLATVAQACGARVADVFSAFDGKDGLFLYYRNGADPSEGHPTNAGYRVMAKAFEDAANQ
jgi:lysophospholipase L1-like esterase